MFSSVSTSARAGLSPSGRGSMRFRRTSPTCRQRATSTASRSRIKPRYVTFQTDTDIKTPGGGAGVKIGSVEYSNEPPKMKYEPGHPDADERGYVRYPAVNMTTEFVDAMEATRAYEANIGVIEVTKNMTEQTLRIIA